MQIKNTICKIKEIDSRSPAQQWWWQLSLFGMLLGAGWGLSQWPPLRESRWWYPDAGYKELWTSWWVGLYALSTWWSHRTRTTERSRVRWLWHILWCASLIVAFSGFWAIVAFVNSHYTTGDLFTNHFLGAQRAYSGLAIYDLKGLYQSVNASPFVITILKPFGGMSNKDFLPWWLAFNVVLWMGFVIYAWLWLRWLWRSYTKSLGLPEFGVLVCTSVYFNSFQRSWRLGQLDIWVLILITAGSYHLCKYLLDKQTGSLHACLGGILLALAVGVKFAPALLALPLLLWWIKSYIWPDNSADGQLLRRRWKIPLISGIIGCILVILVSWAGLGLDETSRFAQNINIMQEGSTAGVNFALVGRLAKYRDKSLRLKHHPLPAQDRAWLWPLRILVLSLLLWLVWRLPLSQLPLYLAFGLACLPLVSPMCWDIYFIWCAYFPWLLCFGIIASGNHQLWPYPAKYPSDDKIVQSNNSQIKLRKWLTFMMLGASFYLMGLAGNSVVRDIHTLNLIELELPLWFDEARLLGLLLLFILMTWLMQSAKSHARKSCCNTM
jgi:hypothetical protein